MNSKLVKPYEPDGKDNKRAWRQTDWETEIGTKQTTSGKPQSTNCSRNISWDRRCAKKKTIRKTQPARYKGNLSNSAKKRKKDEHLLCTAKQKYYNLLKSKIVNSLSPAIKNDKAKQGQGKIGKITDGAIKTKIGRKGSKCFLEIG